MVQRYLFRLAYQGTDYCGWQIQPKTQSSKPSVQEKILLAFNALSLETLHLSVSGRTDAGVHALDQTFHVDLTKEVDYPLVKALNAHLPNSIRILSMQKTASDFHARFHVRQKEYRYYWYEAASPYPLLENTSVHRFQKYDLNRMKDALESLKGTHDFKAFQASDADVEDTVRTVFDAEILNESILSIKNIEHLEGWKPYCLSIKGNGFLKHMVRSIVGTLWDIGRGHKTVDLFGNIFQVTEYTAARHMTGEVAPANGLYLYQVDYS